MVAPNILGNSPVTEAFSLKREIRRFTRDPLEPLVRYLDDGGSLVTHGDLGRYYRAYDFYAGSLGRVLQHIAIGRRFQSEVRPQYGGRRKLSERQRDISARYRSQRPYFELDFVNFLIHARILLDRTVGLSRRFLAGQELPSFTSFNGHKKFLGKQGHSLGAWHRLYCQRIVEQTDWFEMLKFVRDKLVVHMPPEHFLFLGYPSYQDLEIIFIPVRRGEQDDFGRSTCLKVSVRRLARDIEAFLDWYNGYALAAVKAAPKQPQ